MAARLHHQDSSAGAAAPHDPQGEHEAVSAARGQHLLNTHWLIMPNLLQHFFNSHLSILKFTIKYSKFFSLSMHLFFVKPTLLLLSRLGRYVLVRRVSTPLIYPCSGSTLLFISILPKLLWPFEKSLTCFGIIKARFTCILF